MNLIPAMAAAVILSACAASPPLTDVSGVIDPATAVPSLNYRSVTSGTIDYAPVEPLPWDELNRGVSPSKSEPQS